MSSAQKIIQAAAGNAAGEGLYVEEIFSTYLYTGNGSTQTITNGIDLDGEGGLVWIKSRGTRDHVLFDTERGTLAIESNTADAQASNRGLTAYTSSGFSLNDPVAGDTNATSTNFVSWTFRKAPKFFDVVTYTGDGTSQSINHNLGAVPGVVIVKDYSGSGNSWTVYHRSVGNTGGLLLNDTNSTITSTTFFNDTDPTDTTFTVGSATNTNASGRSFVAYLFAHNDGDGEFGEDADQDIIKCGSYTGNGSTDGPEIDLGFEPQWVVIKNASAASNWTMIDTMRGWTNSSADDPFLAANSSQQEFGNPYTRPLAKGFQPTTTSSLVNTSGNTYIYIAIRRGPMKTPESGTEVFYVKNGDGDFTSDFPADLVLSTKQSTQPNYVMTRLLGDTYLETETSDAEAGTGISNLFADQTGVNLKGTWYGSSDTDVVGWMFRRAPGFFDVVCYSGDSVENRAVPHNLTVTPEMMILKRRSGGNGEWPVYHIGLIQGSPTDVLFLNDTLTPAQYGGFYDPPDQTNFYVDDNDLGNLSGSTYVNYLFATLPGVSKVFSVTKSSGSDATVDCGFSAGSRFVLLKRTDSTGDWYVWDSERGIVAGDDPYLLLNSTAAEVTNTDYIDPDSSGFTIVDGGLADGDYIGLAIA